MQEIYAAPVPHSFSPPALTLERRDILFNYSDQVPLKADMALQSVAETQSMTKRY